MKIAGIVLIVLQCLGVIGGIIVGRNPFAGGIAEAVGYFLFGIVGVILLVADHMRKKKKNDNKDEEEEN